MPNNLKKSDVYMEAASALHAGDSAKCCKHLLNSLIKQPQDLLLLNALLSLANMSSGANVPTALSNIKAHLNATKIPYTAASAGWRYASHLEKSFIVDTKEALRADAQTTTDTTTPSVTLTEMQKPSLKALAEIEDPKTLFETLKGLSTRVSPALNQDDFQHGCRQDLESQLDRVFMPSALNIVVLGAGPVGLLLSHALKRSLRNKVQILMIETRTIMPGWKKSYTRGWLTHILKTQFAGIVDEKIMQIFHRIGDGVNIGAPLNVLENILLLGARNSGVNVLFHSQPDLQFIAHSKVNCLFDTTGGRMDWGQYPGFKSGTDNSADELTLSMPETANYGKGFDTFGIVNHSVAPALRASLRKNGQHRQPYVDGHIPIVPMLKITGLPAAWLPSVKLQASTNNLDSKFYIWPGRLNAPINEGLILVNIHPELYRLLLPIIPKSRPVEECLNSFGSQIEELDPRLYSVLKGLSNEAIKSCQLEPPFVYQPWIRTEPFADDTFFGRPVFPLGDSLFNGHPKVGNGLSGNLTLTRQLHDVIAACMAAGA